MTKVKLRRRPISQGRQTLYLDFYSPIPHPDTGKLTRREFLSLYLYENPKAPFDKQNNKETLLLAENVRAKGQLFKGAASYQREGCILSIGCSMK